MDFFDLKLYCFKAGLKSVRKIIAVAEDRFALFPGHDVAEAVAEVESLRWHPRASRSTLCVAAGCTTEDAKS
jgi:hypothetical protein